eukprot:gene3837-15131_t
MVIRGCCALKRGLFSRRVSPETYLPTSASCTAKANDPSGHSAVQTMKESDNLDLETRFRKEIANGQKEKNNKNLIKAVKHFQESLRIAEKSNLGCWATTQALSELGAAYFDMQNYDNALETFLRMRCEADKSHDLKGLKTANHNTATVYDIQENHAEAIKYYSEKIRIALEIDDVTDLEATHNDLAEAYFTTDCLNEAAENFQKAFELAGAKNSKVEESFACRRLGDLYYNNGKYKKSLHYKRKQLKFAVESGDTAEELETNKAIGAIYCALKKYQLAKKYYKETLRIARTLGDERILMTAEEDIVILNKMLSASESER